MSHYINNKDNLNYLIITNIYKFWITIITVSIVCFYYFYSYNSINYNLNFSKIKLN